MDKAWWRRAVVGSICALLIATGAAWRPGPPDLRAAEVTFLPVEPVADFPDAAAPGAIQYACAPQQSEIEAFFAARKLEFDAALLRRQGAFGVCHVYYEPTLPGFRAGADSGQVIRIFGDADPMGFVARRKPVGDSLDIVKAVLRQLPRPVDVTLSLPALFPPEHSEPALRFHFPDTRHRISIVTVESTSAVSWAQDYIKAGQVAGELRILTPRRLYEGRTDTAAVARSLLDNFKEKPFARSKLSWEGGDLQFAADPADAASLILFYGGTARDYWGASLSPAECEYVLRTEFGASRAVGLASFGPHADMLVSFLPDGKTVLLAEPVRDDLEAANSAVTELLALYGDRAPPELARLPELIGQIPRAPGPAAAEIRGLIERLRQALPLVPPAGDPELHRALNALTRKLCPAEAASHFSPDCLRAMLQADPGLLERAVNASADAYQEAAAAPKLLGLIEAQLPGAPAWIETQLDEKANELATLGFRVVRVPYLAAPPMLKQWAGISYVNLLAVGNRLFVPAFGLGSAEERLFARMRRDIGAEHEVVAVPSRFSLLNNAGVHCVFGVVRASILTD